MDQVRGVILFEGRSGSSHLTSLINQHKDAVFYGEVLASFKEESWERQNQWLESLCSQKNIDTKDKKLIGFKTKTREILDRTAFNFFLKEKEFKIIRLYRKNIFKQILSAIRADRLRKQNGLFNIKEEEKSQKVPSITIELDELQYWYHIMSRYEQDVDDFIMKTNNQKLLVCYEDLLYEKEATLSKIFDFFNLEYYVPDDVYVKHTNDDWEKDVKNYKEVKAFCEGSRLVNYL